MSMLKQIGIGVVAAVIVWSISILFIIDFANDSNQRHDDYLTKHKDFVVSNIPSAATDVKLIDNTWVVFRLYDQCMMVKVQAGVRQIGLSSVSDKVCLRAVDIITNKVDY